jgi:hypothetical protein
VASSRISPSLADRRVGENESLQVFQDRELGAAYSIADRARLAMGSFRLEQTGDERIEFVAPGQTLAGDLVEAGAHSMKFQFLHDLQDLVTLH